MFFEFEKYLDAQKGDTVLINLGEIARITREAKTAFAGPTAEWTRLYLSGGGKEDFIDVAVTYDNVRAILEQNGLMGKAAT